MLGVAVSAGGSAVGVGAWSRLWSSPPGLLACAPHLHSPPAGLCSTHHAVHHRYPVLGVAQSVGPARALFVRPGSRSCGHQAAGKGPVGWGEPSPACASLGAHGLLHLQGPSAPPSGSRGPSACCLTARQPDASCCTAEACPGKRRGNGRPAGGRARAKAGECLRPPGTPLHPPATVQTCQAP